MLSALAGVAHATLGLDLQATQLAWYQVSLRALLVYMVVLAITRSGHRRFLGKGTAFDVVIGILLGSVASRAITGNAPFVPTLAACAVLVWIHSLAAWSAHRWRRFARLAEGEPVTLVSEGEADADAMRRTRITDEDLQEGLRLRGTSRVRDVKLACLERNGRISVIPRGKDQVGASFIGSPDCRAITEFTSAPKKSTAADRKK